MKKIVFLLLATFCAASACPQYVIQRSLNGLRPGDRLIKREMQYKDPGRSGKDVLWDFSRLAPVEKRKMVLTKPVEEIDVNTNLSQFLKEVDGSYTEVSLWTDPDGSVTLSEQGALFRHKATGDSLLVLEYENPSTKVSNDLPELWLKYPFAYKDKLFSYFTGEGTYYEQTGVSVMGSLSVEADAYGMMILPGGDTLDNVLRVHSLKTTLDDRVPLVMKKKKKEKAGTDSIAYFLKKNKMQILTEVIRWYGEGYRYPVFETWSTVFLDENGKAREEERQAFFYHPVDQEEDYLQTDSANLAIVEKNKKDKDKKIKKAPASPDNTFYASAASLSYNIYPNPTRGDMQVEIYLPEETPVQWVLYSIQGGILYSSKMEKHKGIFQEILPTGGLPQGNYVLRITCGEKTFSEKIVKQ